MSSSKTKCFFTSRSFLIRTFRCERSPLLRIREHSSKALLALIHHDQYSTIILQRIQRLIDQSKEQNRLRQNTLHGRLLQVLHLFQSMKRSPLLSSPNSCFLSDHSEMREKCLPPNHRLLGIAYNNIGQAQRELGEYCNALSSHQKTLSMKQKTLPPND